MSRDDGGGAEAEGAPHPYREEELAWIGEHLTQLRQSVDGQRLVLQSLGIGLPASKSSSPERCSLSLNVEHPEMQNQGPYLRGPWLFL